MNKAYHLAKKRLIKTAIILSLALSACQPDSANKIASALHISSGHPVVEGTEMSFPRDHASHNEQGIEWWYVTANVKSEAGKMFGVQWTLFRSKAPSPIKSTWWDDNVYFAHFAIQDQKSHWAFERFARAKQVDISSMPFRAAIDDWHLASINDSFLPLKLNASAKEVEGEHYAVALTLSNSPLVLHGNKGYSQKTESGHASYYYSYPFLQVTGKLTFAGQQYQVTGNAWLDREWSASLLDKNQGGWDWFSIVDASSDKKGLMLFCIREADQGYEFCRGTRIDAHGRSSQISTEEINLSVIETVSLDKRQYPSKWQVILPDTPVIIIESITKDSRNQLTIPYWEGRIKATGGFNGKGYAELTGY